MAAAQQMQVQMEDGLAGAAAVVKDRAIAGEEMVFGGKFRGDELEFAKKGSVARLRVLQRGEMFAGADEDVHGSLRADVFEGEDVVVVVDEFGWNLLCANLAKQAVRVHFT